MADPIKYLLAIDTASNFAGLALWGGGQVWAEETWYSTMAHSVQLMPRVDRMLKTRDLDVQELAAIAVSTGPGSYTGLRIGMAAAKGLALPHRLPLIGIPTLDATAHPFRGETRPVWAVLSAGRGKLGVACYDAADDGWKQVAVPTITTVEGLVDLINTPAVLVGEIDPTAAFHLCQALGPDLYVPSPTHRFRRPGCVAEMAAERLSANHVDDLATLTPIYLRTPEGKEYPPETGHDE